MKRPSFIKAKYRKKIDQTSIKDMNVFGSSHHGGLTHTPFGSTKFNAYWTVGGDKRDRFECASYHENTGGFVRPEEKESMVYTHHSIFFRGDPATDEEQRERLMGKKK